jgi:hypothetical protein
MDPPDMDSHREPTDAVWDECAVPFMRQGIARPGFCLPPGQFFVWRELPLRPFPVTIFGDLLLEFCQGFDYLSERQFC